MVAELSDYGVSSAQTGSKPQINSWSRNRAGEQIGATRAEHARREEISSSVLRPETPGITHVAIDNENQVEIPMPKLDPVHEVDPPRPQVFGQPDVKDSVDGVVLAFEGNLVACELALPEGPARAHLPKELFPEGFVPGTCFSLQVADNEGFKRPIVLARTPDLSAEVKALHEEIDQVLAMLV